MFNRLESLSRSVVLLLALLFLGTCAMAQTAPQDKTTADIRLELLQQMQQDGFLSDKLAQQARLKYVDLLEANSHLIVFKIS